MFKHYKYKLVKIHRTYKIRDICRLFREHRLHSQTVRKWIKEDGLDSFCLGSTFYVYGEVLKNFLQEKSKKNKLKLKFHEFKCWKCHTKSPPLNNTIEKLTVHKNNFLVAYGICPVCKRKSQRSYKMIDEPKIAKIFKIKQNELSLLSDSSCPVSKTNMQSVSKLALNESLNLGKNEIIDEETGEIITVEIERKIEDNIEEKEKNENQKNNPEIVKNNEEKIVKIETIKNEIFDKIEPENSKSHEIKQNKVSLLSDSLAPASKTNIKLNSNLALSESLNLDCYSPRKADISTSNKAENCLKENSEIEKESSGGSVKICEKNTTNKDFESVKNPERNTENISTPVSNANMKAEANLSDSSSSDNKTHINNKTFDENYATSFSKTNLKKEIEQIKSINPNKNTNKSFEQLNLF